MAIQGPVLIEKKKNWRVSADLDGWLPGERREAHVDVSSPSRFPLVFSALRRETRLGKWEKGTGQRGDREAGRRCGEKMGRVFRLSRTKGRARLAKGGVLVKVVSGRGERRE